MTQSPQRLGKGMIYAAWILVLILLTLFFNHFIEHQNNPNQAPVTQYHQDGYRQVLLQRNRSGHYVTNGSINNQSVVFFLDTGATTVSIPESVALRLNLPRGSPFLVETANGTVTAYSTIIDSIAIGEIKLSEVRASINPAMQSEEVLLGMSFLKQLEFTQRGDQLTIRQYHKE
ncbi:MAG: TIGR02281 family clan AA aspartic protease [Thioploca sp.]|nr:TIGR02281 family clan AA aspartic protease [Thioploca sp.]